MNWRRSSTLVMRHGSAAKHWLYKGDDMRGTGWREPAKKWQVGESLKQNRFLLPTMSNSEDTVSITLQFGIKVDLYQQ